MKVSIISSSKQQFNGINYWKDKSTGYYKNAQHKPYSLHRTVWEFHNGKIPKGYVIDHIDRDRNNNQIENLRLATSSENNHNVAQSEIERRREWASRIRPLTKEWHKSEAGREWHRLHGIECYNKRKPIVKICAHCGKEYTTTKYSTNARFCGNNCKMKARRRRFKGLAENATL